MTAFEKIRDRPLLAQSDRLAKSPDSVHPDAGGIYHIPTALVSNLTVIFSALPDAGDFLKRLSVKPAGRSASYFFGESLSTHKRRSALRKADVQRSREPSVLIASSSILVG